LEPAAVSIVSQKHKQHSHCVFCCLISKNLLEPVNRFDPPEQRSCVSVLTPKWIPEKVVDSWFSVIVADSNRRALPIREFFNLRI
jgi:hypothetical protein